jgi:TPP-dependent indolepyruvate ferredoxin oxidoreductase alpha subunit
VNERQRKDVRQSEEMALRPLTRVRMARERLSRAEQVVDETRLELVKEIEAARKAGHSMGEVGVAMGVSYQRVHQLLKWAQARKPKK